MFKLRLKNYRGFINEEFIFSKINILIGENSAGKSSIFKFLLALKQSLRAPNNRDSNLTFSGIDTDLGNYKEAIYKHETNRNLLFSFEFQKNYFDFFIKDTISVTSSRKEDEDRVSKLIQQKRQDVINSLKGEVITPTIAEFELSEDLSVHNNIKTTIHNASIGTVQIIHKENTDNIAEQDIYLINDKPVCNILFKSLTGVYLLENVAYEKLGFLTIVVGDSLREKVEAINTNSLIKGKTPDF